MTDYSTIAGTVFFDTIVPNHLTIPAGAVENASIVPGASVDYTKLQHLDRFIFSQAGAVSSATERRVVAVIRGSTATIRSVRAGQTTASVGDSTVNVDVKVNGVTALTGTINLGTTSAFSLVAGTLSTTSLVAGDVVEVSVVATANTGTLGKGVFCVVEISQEH
jgi:hypothetical protein